MRKFKLLASIAFVLTFMFQTNAQDTKSKVQAELNRCATMEHLEAYYKENPRARTLADQNANRSGGNQRVGNTYRLNAIATLPVVIHIVLPNPNVVTDADVNYFINRLNIDYSGLNPDSANAGPFLALRGHSQIRFCLSRRTPAGLLSTGIERRASATGSNANLAVDPIKRSAQGGLDAWDNTAYVNIWVGNDISGQGILGYATFPGTAGAADDGVFLNFQSFANNSCITIPAYNLGRTGSHEVGHYLGLYHIWGDENACTGDDFRQLPGTCILPAGLFNPAGQGNTPTDVGDTPNQAANTTTCPSGVVTDACATVAPGKMYQNYMDYTADACYSMFTNQQVARMEWVVDNCRASLKTSLGCTAPAGAITLDAAPFESVNPGGNEVNGCATTTYPSIVSCPGSFIPKVRIINNGLNTLTTVTVGYRLNNGPAVITSVSPNLAYGGTAVVSFPPITTAIGTYSFRYFTTNPNGTNPDQNPANDSTTAVLTVSGPSPLPISQGFEVANIAPWAIVNPNGDNTWVRATPGSNSTVALAIDNYNNTVTGRIDELRSPVVSTAGTDSVIVSFDVAHKNYPGANDVLQVLVSTDCGATFTSVYSKSGATLATAGSSTAAYVAPAATDWRRERVSIGGAPVASGQVLIAFRNTNAYGNNIWLDNINISKKVGRDLIVSAILSPSPNICTNSFTPQVTVTNSGSEAVTGFSVGYRIGNAGTIVNQAFTQTIAPFASANVTLAAATGLPTGANSITAFTFSPVAASGTGDQQSGNDTLTKAFTVATIFTLPLSEGFEAATFPPANWTLINPNNNVTWVRDNHGHNSSWSAKIDNYNNSLAGQVDGLQTPALRVTGTDSMIVAFDVAHKNYTGANDILQVLVSTDCGNTFTSYYSKSGTALATAGASTADYTNPAQSDWRRERVSIPTAAVASGNVIVRFQNTNAYGNNIFIDNINITSIYKRDLQLVSINQPANILCTTNVTPSVTVRNVGIDTIRGFKVAYIVDNGTAVSATVSNVAIAAGASQTLNLAAATLAIGSHTFKAYTFDPVTTAGTGDPNPTNDTLSKTVGVVGSQAAPLVEGFEGKTFPPVGWAINNVDGDSTWQRTDSFPRVVRADTASAYVRNFKYTNAGSRDELYTPRVTYTGVDSVFLSFDVAATTKNYPGSTEIPLDTLEVLVTNDCGATLTSVYKKWGNELQTVNDPNNAQIIEFRPSSRGQWRNERINLSAYVTRSPIQVVFRNTTNSENDIYLDNVNLNTKTLPAKLKEQGYLIYPSPFVSSFTIQHYLPPTELRSVGVYNAVGQLMVAQNYGNNGATSLMQIDMSRFANGLYTVVLRYTNRTVSQKIIKGQ